VSSETVSGRGLLRRSPRLRSDVARSSAEAFEVEGEVFLRFPNFVADGSLAAARP
jgi:hypothetical protein